MRNKVITYCIAILVIGTSCKKIKDTGCVTSTGKITKELRSIPAYKNIELYDNVNLILVQDSIFQVEVEAGENLLSEITTEIEGNTLFIRNKNSCNWVRSYKNPINVYCTVPDLKILTCFGSGNVETKDTLSFLELSIESWGASSTIDMDLNLGYCRSEIFAGNADITLRGNCTRYNQVLLADAGKMDLEGFRTRAVFVETKGIGDIYINAWHLIHAEINYKGSVYYTGNPDSISVKTTDLGRLISR